MTKEPLGKAVGFIQLYPSFSSVAAKLSWVLNDLFVANRHRGKGVAKLLMEAARELAENSGATNLSLQTSVDNHPAQRLYESRGYERESEFLAIF